MEHSSILVVAVVLLAFGVVSRRLEGSLLTLPMVFVALGLVAGPHGLGWFAFDFDTSITHWLTELTLILVLFGDATRIDMRTLRKGFGLPTRLLLIGMPLTILLGTFVAHLLFPAWSWAEAALLAAILTPTDAALGMAVVSNPRVPLRIRQALNVESGLNDGLALPIILVLASLAGAGHADARTAGDWTQFVALQVTLGPVAGALVGWAGGRVIRWADAREWMSEHFERLSGLALAVLSFVLAEEVGGNGFVAAFVAGLALGNSSRGRCHALYAFLEAEGQLLMVLVFLLLGASVGGAVPPELWPLGLLYAALSLTLVRAAPVAIALLKARLRLPSIAFLGWFGPRGLASVLFGLHVMGHNASPHHEALFGVVLITVIVSVYAHGLTSAPSAARYGQFVEASSCPAEVQPVAEHPLRSSPSRGIHPPPAPPR